MLVLSLVSALWLVVAARQDEFLDGLGETLVIVGGRHAGGLPGYRPCARITSMTAGPTSAGISRSSMMVMSGCAMTPPLKAAIGPRISSGWTSMRMPRGGRPLVMANRYRASAAPAARVQIGRNSVNLEP